jgi:hypothetical protein
MILRSARGDTPTVSPSHETGKVKTFNHEHPHQPEHIKNEQKNILCR